MEYMINPKTGRKIKIGGKTYNDLVNDGYFGGEKKPKKTSPVRKPSTRSQRSPTRVSRSPALSPSRKAKPGCSNAGKYKDVKPSDFCGPEGGACEGTYPVNTPGRAKSALSYARHAPNPQGIRDCVYRKAGEKGWLNSEGKIVINSSSRSRNSSSKSPIKRRRRSRSRTCSRCGGGKKK